MRVVCLFLWASLLSACGALATAEGDSCDSANDCVWPAVCCSEPNIVALDEEVPLCESFRRCKAFLPVLVEGNPCHRTGNGNFAECGTPWLCCQKTLLCSTEAACEAAPEPVPFTSAGDECSTDTDCEPEAVCMGIDIRDRDGFCQGIVVPPDTLTP